MSSSRCRVSECEGTKGDQHRRSQRSRRICEKCAGSSSNSNLRVLCTLTLKIAHFREDFLTTNGHQLTRIDPSNSRSFAFIRGFFLTACGCGYAPLFPSVQSLLSLTSPNRRALWLGRRRAVVLCNVFIEEPQARPDFAKAMSGRLPMIL